MKCTVKKMIGSNWMDGVETVAEFDTLDDAKAYIQSEPHEGFCYLDYFVLYGRNNKKFAKFNSTSGMWDAE